MIAWRLDHAIYSHQISPTLAAEIGSKKIMNKGFVDFHSHLLPALDDGAIDERESLEMARVLAGFGFAVVHCTPHMIKGGYENPPERVRQATRSLQRRLDQAEIPLRLIPGTEHYLDEYLSEQAPGALTVGSSRYLLVEAPFRSGGEMLPVIVAELKQRGFLPLFAHPERCSVFQLTREEGMRGALSFVLGKRKESDLEGSLLSKLKDSGCRFQGNLGSFAGFYGNEVRQRAIFFLKHGVYSCLGSDAHSAEHLTRMLSSGFEVVVAVLGEVAAHELLKGSAAPGSFER